MLGRANEALSIRLAGSEVKVHALSSQLEVAEARVLELQVRGRGGRACRLQLQLPPAPEFHPHLELVQHLLHSLVPPQCPPPSPSPDLLCAEGCGRAASQGRASGAPEHRLEAVLPHRGAGGGAAAVQPGQGGGGGGQEVSVCAAIANEGHKASCTLPSPATTHIMAC